MCILYTLKTGQSFYRQCILLGLIIYDNDKYGKILPDHWAMLSTLPKEVDEFMSSHFSQSMTGKPYSAQPLDLWIECTMNKGSKMKAF